MTISFSLPAPHGDEGSYWERTQKHILFLCTKLISNDAGAQVVDKLAIKFNSKIFVALSLAGSRDK
jgi:hypothetical protein